MLYVDLYNVPNIHNDYSDVICCDVSKFITLLDRYKLNSASIEICKFWNENNTSIVLESLYEDANYMCIHDDRSNILYKFYFILSSGNVSSNASYYDLQLDVWHTFMLTKQFEIKSATLSMLSKPRHNEIVLKNSANIGQSSNVYISREKDVELLSPQERGTLFAIMRGTNRSFLLYATIDVQNILQYLYALAVYDNIEIVHSGTKVQGRAEPLKVYFIPNYTAFYDDVKAQFDTPTHTPPYVQDEYLCKGNDYLKFTDDNDIQQNIKMTSVLVEKERNDIFETTLIDDDWNVDTMHKYTIGTIGNQIELPKTNDAIHYELKLQTDLLLDFKFYLEVNYDNVIDLTSDFELPFTTSEFESWYNRNQATLQAANANNKIQIATSLIMAGASLAAAPLSAGASVVGAVSGIASATTSAFTFTNQQRATIEAAKKQPALVNSFFASGFMTTYQSGVCIYKYTPSNYDEFEKLENAYGLMTTTTADATQIFSMLNATNYAFIYIQFSNVFLYCPFAKQTQLNQITNILKNGVRIWLLDNNSTQQDFDVVGQPNEIPYYN